MSAPVLFLDIDGVLNHRGVFTPGNMAPICPLALGRYKNLMERTKAKMVLSSTWRKTRDPDRCHYVQKLKRTGVLDYAHEDWRTRDDVAPQSAMIGDWARRGDEIAEWLSRHPEVNRYAIVDDDSDMLPEQAPFFVQTTFDRGLLDEHCELLEAILIPSPAIGSAMKGAGE